jgi:hypothetical protein
VSRLVRIIAIGIGSKKEVDPDPDSDPDFEEDEFQQAEALDALFRTSDSWREKD